MNISKLVLGVALAVVLVGVFVIGRQSVEAQDDQILPGCNIPKSFGRLVNVIPAPNTGLAAQAVFEGEDGVVRWVPMMFSADLPQLPKATRVPTVMFPQLARYECALGHVWNRH